MRYKCVFLFGSQQEVVATQSKYFIENSEKIVVFYITPRLSSEKNIIKVYKKGELIDELRITTSTNILVCYLLIYYHYIKSLFRYFSYRDKIIVISYHPIAFFFKSIISKLRNYEVVYWVGDYFPANSLFNIIYQSLSNYYNKKAKYSLYLSDRLNYKMNGRLYNSTTKKTVMWGVEQKNKNDKKIIGDKIKLCFVGLIKPSQGIDTLLAVVRSSNHTLSLLGYATRDLELKYKRYIKKYNLAKRVYFPNKSLYSSELEDEINTCDIGIGLYDVGPENGTFFADPAKIKTYIQNGLPIIMTDVAEVTKYITRFKAGIVVDQNVESVIKGIDEIKKNYSMYTKGVKKFNEYFAYSKYYKKNFIFLERYWKDE